MCDPDNYNICHKYMYTEQSMTVYSMILSIFNTVRSQSADQSSLSIKSNVTWLLSCVLYIALGRWTVRNPLLLLNIMVNYSHVGWQFTTIISILYMVWASSVYAILPLSARSVLHQSCISVTMISPTPPTPCMPYVAMVQPSTITKKLHNPLNTMKTPKPMSNPTNNHNYIDVFSCTNVNHTFHFMLPANTVLGYVQWQ